MGFMVTNGFTYGRTISLTIYSGGKKPQRKRPQMWFHPKVFQSLVNVTSRYECACSAQKNSSSRGKIMVTTVLRVSRKYEIYIFAHIAKSRVSQDLVYLLMKLGWKVLLIDIVVSR